MKFGEILSVRCNKISNTISREYIPLPSNNVTFLWGEYKLQYNVCSSVSLCSYICTDRCIHVPLTCVCVTGPLECPKVSTMLSNISFQEAICLHHYCYSISSDTSPQSGNLIIDGILFIHVNLPVYVVPYKSDYSRVFGSLALAAACWLDVVIMSGVKFFDLLYIHSGTNNLPLAGNDWMMERSTQKTDTLSSSIFTRRTLTIWSLSNFFFCTTFSSSYLYHTAVTTFKMDSVSKVE